MLVGIGVTLFEVARGTCSREVIPRPSIATVVKPRSGSDMIDRALTVAQLGRAVLALEVVASEDELTARMRGDTPSGRSKIVPAQQNLSGRKEEVTATRMALMLLKCTSSRGAMEEPSSGVDNDSLRGCAFS